MDDLWSKICDCKCPMFQSTFGPYPRCTETKFSKLTGITSRLESFLPNLQEYLDCNVSMDINSELSALVLHTLAAPSPLRIRADSGAFYASSTKKIVNINSCIALINRAGELCQEIQPNLSRHNCLAQMGKTLYVIGHWMAVLFCTLKTAKMDFQVAFWELLDENPTKSKEILFNLLSSMSGTLDFTLCSP
ncbi:hypothetical protein GYMLUDRAFT_59382 [Collybiopsis luxurians FD-317 M1]|uniref:Uncharacterized protein n=1 Tax=Collybiopsis luxurians FD-317 M1 TaxID=944289 RepID=A0A0D0BAB3_9AGAR|nr:hypothetical protein GYMLUDRAFT_59382 [Collybiopsis luxurians FD-317 M1]